MYHVGDMNGRIWETEAYLCEAKLQARRLAETAAAPVAVYAGNGMIVASFVRSPAGLQKLSRKLPESSK
jgi:hypothetical protein